MGNFMIGDFYPPFLGWVEKIYCGTEQCWPKNDIKDTDVYCFNLASWWCPDQIMPGIPINKDITITGAQMKAGEGQCPFDECAVWMTPDFVLHITSDKLAAYTDNQLYTYWKGRGKFGTGDWITYSNNVVTIQLSAQDFQPTEYTPTDHFAYYQVLSEQPLEDFYNEYENSYISVFYNSWENVSTWQSALIDWYDLTTLPVTKNYTNGNTAWKMVISEAPNETGIIITATAKYNYTDLEVFTEEHLWGEILKQAKFNRRPIFTDQFELKRASRDVQLKVIILDEDGVQKRVDVNRTVTLYNPINASQSYGYWDFAYYGSLSTTNVSISPTWRGTGKRMVWKRTESTDARFTVNNNAYIPLEYLEETGPAATVTWYFTELIGVDIAFYIILAGKEKDWEHDNLFATTKNVYHMGVSPDYPISWVDLGDHWGFYMDTDKLPAGGTWTCVYSAFDSTDTQYTGDAHIENNMLIVDKNDATRYPNRYIGDMYLDFVESFDDPYVQVLAFNADNRAHLNDCGFVEPDEAFKKGVVTPGYAYAGNIRCNWPANILVLSYTFTCVSADEYEVVFTLFDYTDPDDVHTTTYPPIYSRRINGVWQWSETKVFRTYY